MLSDKDIFWWVLIKVHTITKNDYAVVQMIKNVLDVITSGTSI